MLKRCLGRHKAYLKRLKQYCAQSAFGTSDVVPLNQNRLFSSLLTNIFSESVSVVQWSRVRPLESYCEITIWEVLVMVQVLSGTNGTARGKL